jgi:hypothetical protein
MHRETFITKLAEIQENAGQLLSQLQASEHYKFAAHLYRARRKYRSACDSSGKSGKQIERCLISTFKVAIATQSKGFLRPREQQGTPNQAWHFGNLNCGFPMQSLSRIRSLLVVPQKNHAVRFSYKQTRSSRPIVHLILAMRQLYGIRRTSTHTR